MPIIDTFFHTLIERGGSDLHITEGQPPKIRVHGGIKPISDEVLTRDFMETIMREICEPRAWAICRPYIAGDAKCGPGIVGANGLKIDGMRIPPLNGSCGPPP